MADTNTEFTTVTPPGQLPKINSIYDFSAEALGQLKLWLEQNPPTISLSQVTGFQQLVYNRGTKFPTNPINGQLFSLVVDATNGIVWNFRYNTSSSSSYKWEFTGGTPLHHEVATTQANANNGVYEDLATVGPTVTVPAAGEYQVLFGASTTALDSGGFGRVSPYLGAAPSDSNALIQNSTVLITNGARLLSTQTLAASAVVKLQYKSPSGPGKASFANRWLQVFPVRCS